MKTMGLRHIYSVLLLMVFMLPGITAITAIVASHFDSRIVTEVVLEMESESENGKKGSEETNIGFSEYYTNHHIDFTLSPNVDFNRKSNIPLEIDYDELICLSIPTPPPDFFVV